MQLVLKGNRVLAHGENFVAMGGTVVNTVTNKAYQNATIAECTSCPSDIDEVGYEYHAGTFVPCAPYGKGGGNIAVVCNEDCKSVKDSGVSSDNLSNVMSNGLTLSFLPSIDLPSSMYYTAIAFGKGLIIVIGNYDSTNKDYISRDGGETWEAITLPFTHNTGAGIAYDETLDLFVAIKYSSTYATTVNAAAYSTDGVKWTASTLSTSRAYCSLAAGNGLFIAGAWKGGYAEYSTDGINWTQSTDIASYSAGTKISDIKYDSVNKLFVAVAAAASSPCKYSRDGATWSSVGGTISDGAYYIAIGNGLYVLLEADQVYVRKSASLGSSTAWTNVTLPENSSGTDFYDNVFFANGYFFALTADVAEMAVSTDGLTWELISIPKIVAAGGVYTGSKIVFAGTSGAVIDSYDGKNWLYRNEYRFRLANGDDVTDTVKTLLGATEA